MEQDAFAVLLCSQSKRRKSTDQKDKYATCPVCGASVPKAFLQNHTDDCLVKSQQPVQPSEQQRKVARTDTTPSPTAGAVAAAAGAATSPGKSVHSPLQQLLRSPPKAATTAAAGSGASQRPLLPPRQRLPPDEFRAMVSAGWDKALRHILEALEEPPSLDESPAQQSPQKQAQHTTPMQSPRRALSAEHRAPAAVLGTQNAVDAFAVLRSAQAAQKPMEAEMFLEGCGDGSWVFHWRLAGAPWASSAVPDQPAWSATVNANLPRQQHTAHAAGSSGSKASAPAGSAKLRLEISTNIPPGFGAALDWNNPLLPSNGLVDDGPASSNQGPYTDQQWGPDLDQQQQQQGTQGFEPAAALPAGGNNAMRWRGSGSVALISALQKSVRRGRAQSATRIALELLKDPKNAEALTRRLSIICLEDGLLHPQLPLVVWTMMALSKGYVISGHLANALLTVTHQMASMEYRDFLPLDSPPVSAAGVYTAPPSWHAVDAALGVSSQESILVKCMLIRAAYGGMSCDKDMLLSYAGLWTARFSGCTLPPPPPVAAAAPAAGSAAGAGAGADMQQQQQQGVTHDLEEHPGQQEHQQHQQHQQQEYHYQEEQERQLQGQQALQQPGGSEQAPDHHEQHRHVPAEQLSPAPQQEGQSGQSEGQQQEQEQEQPAPHAQDTDMVQDTQEVSGTHRSQLPQEAAEGSAGEGVSEQLRPQWLPHDAEQQQMQQEEKTQQQQQQGVDEQMLDAPQLQGPLQGVPEETQVLAASPGQPAVLAPTQLAADVPMQEQPQQQQQQQQQGGAIAEQPCDVQEQQQGSSSAGVPALDSSRSQEGKHLGGQGLALQEHQQQNHHNQDYQVQQQQQREQQQQQQQEQQQEQQLGAEQQQQDHINMQDDQQQSEEGYALDSEPSLQQSELHSPECSPVHNSLGSQGTEPGSRQQLSSQQHNGRAEAHLHSLHSVGPDSATLQVLENNSSPGVCAGAVADAGVLPRSTDRAGSSGSTPVPGSTIVGPGSTWLWYLQQLYNQLDASAPQRVTVLGSVQRDDINLAAVDMHVAPGLTQHLKEQPQLEAAVRSMITTSTSVAARLSAPDGFDGLINSALWHFRSSFTRKSWLQMQYMDAATAAGASAGPGGQVSRQQLQAAAMAAVAAWSGATEPIQAAGASAFGPGGDAERAAAGGITPNLAERDAAAARTPAASGATAAAAAAAGPDVDMQDVPAEPAAATAVRLQPGVGFSEGALRVLKMELNGVVAHDAQQRQTKQELMPLWRAGLAPLADAWCREYLNRRLY